jgi:hypothetical protein
VRTTMTLVIQPHNQTDVCMYTSTLEQQSPIVETKEKSSYVIHPMSSLLCSRKCIM